MYECKVLADSRAPSGRRLTTVEVTYPRFVHSELLTHRMFSRNTSSSRAIPNEKLRERVLKDPAMPVFWGRNQSGMQAREELDALSKEAAKARWLEARDLMLKASEELAAIGLHKQLCNRLIEAWMPVTVIVSSTEWENFFRLRCHEDAQPEIRAAAEVIREKMAASQPEPLEAGDWHLPLIYEEDINDNIDQTGVQYADLIKLSVARCARVSYLTHDGRRDPAADIALYDRLVKSGHWSPLEHVAAAQALPVRCGNFIGWYQHRAEVDPHFIKS